MDGLKAIWGWLSAERIQKLTFLDRIRLRPYKPVDPPRRPIDYFDFIFADEKTGPLLMKGCRFFAWFLKDDVGIGQATDTKVWISFEFFTHCPGLPPSFSATASRIFAGTSYLTAA